MAGNDSEAPQPQEVEVSIFGTGFGESILVHLGFGDWAIFDSCINPQSHRPAAIEYLETINVDPAHAVRLFLVSHWHDDHIRGAVEVLRSCTGATFSCSDALKFEQFVELSRTSRRSLSDASGIDEFGGIIELLSDRAQASERQETIGPEWAMADRRLLNLNDRDREFAAEIYSLSPSSSVKTLFMNLMLSKLVQPGDSKAKILEAGPNYAAVAAWVRVADAKILLGADLENLEGPNMGWNAIIVSTTRPEGQARIFKVPHHGSLNAHNQGVWDNLVEPSPLALLSPFNRGRSPLPNESDIERICCLAAQAYCAARPGAFSPATRPGTVERTLRRIARSRQSRGGRFGQIRVRFDPRETSTPAIQLFGDAVRLRAS